MNRLGPLAVFLLTFLFTLGGAFPGLSPFRDAGDLAAAASTLGVAHAPGYPLYVLLGRAFQHLVPFGNLPFRLNAFSALCGAGAVLFLFLFVRRRSGGAAACVAAPAAALFPPLAAQSGLSEIYALNALIAAALLWAADGAAALPEPERSRRWAFAAFAAGAGLANHQSLLLAFPALALLLVRQKGLDALHPRFVRLLLGAAALGLSVYLFLPARAAAGAAYVWGEPASFRGLWDVLTRADYGAATLSTRHSTAGAGGGLVFWFSLWRWQWGTAGTLLTAAAGVWAFVRRKEAGGPLLVFWIFTGPVFAGLARLAPGDLSRAILEPAMVLPALAASAALGLAAGALAARGPLLRLAAAGVLLFFFAFKAAPAALAQRQRHNHLAGDYAANLLRTVPPDAVFMMISDAALFSVEHERTVAGRRPDLKVVVDAELPWRWRAARRRHPELFAEGQPDGGLSLVKFQAARRPVYTEGMQAKLIEALAPAGAAARVAWPARDAAALDGVVRDDRFWEFYVRRVPPPLSLVNDYYGRALLKTVSSGGYNAGLLLTQAGRTDAARAAFARALFWNPDRRLRWRETF